jgi:hypothetical protein
MICRWAAHSSALSLPMSALRIPVSEVLMVILLVIDFPINSTHGDVRTEKRRRLQDRSRQGLVNMKRTARERIVPVADMSVTLACLCRHSEPYFCFHPRCSHGARLGESYGIKVLTRLETRASRGLPHEFRFMTQWDMLSCDVVAWYDPCSRE